MAPSQESQALAELFKKIGSSFPEDNPFVARALYDQVASAGREAIGVTIEDVVAEARGSKVPCKRFTPGSVAKKRVILYCHGGGYNFGSANGHRKLTAHLARASQCIVLSVDYRLAPEHKYPAALEDCVTAYEYLLKTEKYTAANIIIGGDSVGGSLSAIVPLAALKRGLQLPVGCLSLSPSYDWTQVDGGSFDTNKDNDVLNTVPFMQKIISNYAEGTGTGYDHPTISPLFATDNDLAKLPPTYITVGGHDMLRDQGVKFAERLQKLGVKVTLEEYEGQQHVFEFLAGRAPEAIESLKKIGSWVRYLRNEGGTGLREAVGMVDM